MLIPLVINGQNVSVPDMATAAALLLELKKQMEAASAESSKPAITEKPALVTVPKPATALVSVNGTGAVTDFDNETAATALRFLKTVRDGAAHGVQSEILLGVFGVSKAKALGSKSAGVNKVITNLGLSVKSVYKNPRTATGRIWKPGRHMSQAISMIEQRLAAH